MRGEKDVAAFFVEENYEKMSDRAAEEIVRVLRENPRAVLVLATGRSPRLAYRKAAEAIRREGIDVGKATFVKLDEWTGLSRRNEATCEYFLEKEFFGPLGVGEKQTLRFDPEAADPEADCRRVAEAFARLPDPDLVILGVGKNGHLGLNEPGRTLKTEAHAAALESATMGHEMLTHAGKPVTGGVTLGLGELFRGKRILLLADGAGKEEAFRYLRNDLISTEIPVSLLKLHPGLLVVANREFFSF